MRGKTNDPKDKVAPAPVELFEKPESDLVPTQFLLPKSLKTELRLRSAQEGRSMSQMAREALEQYLKS